MAAGPFAQGDALDVNSNRVTVLANNQAPGSTYLGRYLTVGDLNGDGIAEIVGAFGGGTRRLAIWNGAQTLSVAPNSIIGNPTGTTGMVEMSEDGACDLTGDGRAELLGGGQNHAFMWYGEANFPTSGIPDRDYNLGVGDKDKPVCVGDVNGDGKPDMAIVIKGGSGNIQLRY